MNTAVIIVDHGSRSAQSNRLLGEVVRSFAERYARCFEIVEPAHMELAAPSIAEAFVRCVERGATEVVVCPFFLGPGKHWQEDIPRLIDEAAVPYPHVPYRLAAPLGVDQLMLMLLAKRIDESLAEPALEPTFAELVAQ